MKLTRQETNFLWEILNSFDFVAADLYGIDQQELMNKLAEGENWLGSAISEGEAVLDELRDIYGEGLEDTDIWKQYKGTTEGETV